MCHAIYTAIPMPIIFKYHKKNIQISFKKQTYFLLSSTLPNKICIMVGQILKMRWHDFYLPYQVPCQSHYQNETSARLIIRIIHCLNLRMGHASFSEWELCTDLGARLIECSSVARYDPRLSRRRVFQRGSVHSALSALARLLMVHLCWHIYW